MKNIRLSCNDNYPVGVPSPELFSVPDSGSDGASLRNPLSTAGLDFPLPCFCLAVEEAV